MTSSERINQSLLTRLPEIIMDRPISRYLPEAGAASSSISKEPKRPTSSSEKDSSQQQQLLQHIHENHFMGVKARFEHFKYRGRPLGFRQGEELLHQMEKDSYVTCISVREHARGAATRYYIPTEKGYDLIGNPAGRLIAPPGASLEQAFLQQFFAHEFTTKHNIQATPEFRRNGKRADLAFRDQGLLVALEFSLQTTIEWEARQAFRNVQEAGFDRSVTIFLDHNKFKRASDIFAKEIGPSIDQRIKIAEPWHILACEQLHEIYEFKGLTVKLKNKHEEKE